MKKVLKWLKENKEEIVEAIAIGLFLLVLGLMLFIAILVAMTDDLVDRVEKEVREKQVLQQERNYYYGLYDSIIQSYEDVIPKGQYIQDVEYLESVILQLRQACGEECEGI